MNFYSAFDAWLRAQLTTYISDRTSLLASLLEPLAVSLAAVYVMVWGWLQLSGRIQEPVLDAARRLVWVGIVLGLALRLWAYHALFIDTFLTAPQRLANALAAGAAAAAAGGSPSAVADTVLADGMTVAEALWRQGGVFDGQALLIAGAGVAIAVLACSGYTAFLEVLARVALTVLLALGPLFLLALLFDATRRFFSSWVMQLANYGLIVVLTGAVAGLLLEIVRREAAALAAAGPEIEIAQVTPLVAACVVVLLVLRQVMPIAAGLAGGLALGSMHAVDRLVGWGASRTGQFTRGLADRDRSHWDPVARRLGQAVALPARAALRAASGGRRAPLPRRALTHKEPQ